MSVVVANRRPRNAIVVKTAYTAQPRKGARRQQKKKLNGPAGPRAGMDTAGGAYAKLLNDPCNATPVKPLYGGTGTGYLSRFTKEASFSSDTGIFAWVPSAGPGSTPVSYWSGASGSAVIGNRVYNAGPGQTFLSASASECRVVAACITTIYTGTELNRAGIINRAQLNGGDVNDIVTSPVTSTFDTIASLFPQECRTPDTPLEAKFAPGLTDGMFHATNATIVATPGMGGIAVMWRGLGGQPIKFRLTLVVEWRPTSIEGLVAPVSTGNISSWSTERVVASLYAADPQWAFTKRMLSYAGRAALSYMSTAATGGALRLTY